jgi:hypothetical protein
MGGSEAERLRGGRVIVIPKHRILFVPIPKSGCTSVKWSLAQLAGLPPERFRSNRESEVTRALAVHVMSMWDDQYRWSLLSAVEQDAIITDDSWLRFGVVREPASRLWSAWQSKLLLAEPWFHQRFAAETWFPDRIKSVDAMIANFREFVHALASDDPPHDSHWAPQHPMVAGYELNFVGRAERPDATSVRLREFAGPAADFGDFRRENRSLLPYSPAVYDENTAAVVNSIFADDFANFGYDPVVPGSRADDSWLARAEAGLVALDEVRARHERIGDLVEMLRDSDKAVIRLERRVRRILRRERKARRASVPSGAAVSPPVLPTDRG